MCMLFMKCERYSLGVMRNKLVCELLQCNTQYLTERLNHKINDQAFHLCIQGVLISALGREVNYHYCHFSCFSSDTSNKYSNNITVFFTFFPAHNILPSLLVMQMSTHTLKNNIWQKVWYSTTIKTSQDSLHQAEL